jgi:hypothetical protein
VNILEANVLVIFAPSGRHRDRFDWAGQSISSINFGHAIEAPANQTARLASFSVFLCPSDSVKPSWDVMMREPSGTPTQVICQVAPSNCVGMFGTSEPGMDGDGVFYRDGRVGIRDITDGTSPTIAVGERSHKLGEATWVGSVTGAILDPAPGDKDGIGRPRTEDAPGMILGHVGEGKGPGDPNNYLNQFYSLHSGGGLALGLVSAFVIGCGKDLDDV